MLHIWILTLALAGIPQGLKVGAQEIDYNYECRLKQQPTPVILQTSDPQQGRPGKRGPVGSKGAKGSKGESAVVDYDKVVENVNLHITRINQTECSSIGINGESTIYTAPYEDQGLKVYCDTSTDGGRWIVFQRRENGLMNFHRTWKEYANGFGSKSGEFWLGLEILHQLTKRDRYELLVELEDFDGNKAWAKYSTFSIGDVASMYTLTVDGYSGIASDSLGGHNGMKFTTKDSDNDNRSDNCAETFSGAWWYQACHVSNLNGKYFEGGQITPQGVTWYYWKGSTHYSLKFSEMKMRKIVG